MIGDDGLDAVLTSVGAHLDTSRVTALADVSTNASAPSAPSRPARRWRPALAAAIVVAVVAGAVLAIAPARRTVGGWLGIGRTEFRVDVDLAVPVDRLPSFLDGGDPIAPSEAADLAGVPVDALDESPLGAPDAWLAAPEGGAVAVWRADDTTLWLLPMGEVQEMLFTKSVATAEQVRQLADLGDGGVAVEGDHVLATPFRTVRAGSAVLWTSGDLSFRLEAAATDVADLVASASAIEEAVGGSGQS